ncbi:hypothetical protein [Mycoplasma buteonis]|uniref:hypothetical protein n=1 Tax=Mycoplasma buteonis TaxID=171280 RepID=UPI00056347C6|nr:hypothetical protein [Mycoplasma buteonis]
MKLEEAKKLEIKDLERITVGFSAVALISSIGALANAIAPIVGLIKVAMSPQGEIKDKTVGYKWQLTDKTSKSTIDTFTTFE